jgi:hypothetical protein
MARFVRDKVSIEEHQQENRASATLFSRQQWQWWPRSRWVARWLAALWNAARAEPTLPVIERRIVTLRGPACVIPNAIVILLVDLRRKLDAREALLYVGREVELRHTGANLLNQCWLLQKRVFLCVFPYNCPEPVL